jgi:hypothetical protein
MSRLLLFLADGHDHGATEVAQLIGRESPELQPMLISPAWLSLAGWSHRISAGGTVSTRIDLPDGRSFDSGEIAKVVNRIRWLPAPRFLRSSPKNRDYAAAEAHALVTSWLTSLGPRVLPPVGGNAPLIPEISPLAWRNAARREGVPVAPLTVPGDQADRQAQSDRPDEAPGTRDLLVTGKHCGGGLADRYGEPCRRIARRLGFPLLLFRFAGSGSGPQLMDIDPIPPLDHDWQVQQLATALLA